MHRVLINHAIIWLCLCAIVSIPRKGEGITPHSSLQRAEGYWPAYYAYYRHPYAPSGVYYYSFPLNSADYMSRPTTQRDTIVPSYPYDGRIYVNGFPTAAPHLSRPRTKTRSTSHPSQGGSAEIFLGNKK